MNIEHRAISIHEAFENISSSYPLRKFIIYQDCSYTYQEIDQLSNNLAGLLIAAEIKPGDKICLALPRIPELVISFLGATKLGAVPAPVNYTLPEAEFNDFIRRVQPSALIVHSDFAGQLESDINNNPKITKILVNGEASGFTPWQEVSQHRNPIEKIPVKADDISYLNFTTGSSGLPKGAIATHANLYWNTVAAVETFQITENDVHLCMFASFAHPHEIFARAIFTGGSLVLLDKVNPRTIVKTINRHHVTCMMGLAPMYEMIITHCHDKQLPSLRIAESGGMYSRPDIIERFHDLFKIPVLSVWGSTETSGIALANTPDNFKKDGSTGRPCPHYDVRIIDDEGNDVETGKVGELIFRGKGVIKGYDTKATKAISPFLDGWYHSGDLATRDEEGYHYFIERKSGMIKVAGLKVYPLQVEKVIQEYPGIKEIAIIGVKERRHGIVPKAFLTTADNHPIEADAIRQFCKNKLPNYMLPKQFVVLAELPKIGSGKVDKKALLRIQAGKNP